MSKEQLENKIKEEIASLEKQKETTSSFEIILDKFSYIIDGIAIIDLKKLNIYTLCVLYFLSLTNNYTYEEAKKYLYPLKEIISKVFPEDIKVIFESIKICINYKEDNFIKEIIKDKNYVKNLSKEQSKRTKMINIGVIDSIYNIVHTIEKYDLDLAGCKRLIDLIKHYPYEMQDIANGIASMKVIYLVEAKEKIKNIFKKIDAKDFEAKCREYIDFDYIYKLFDKVKAYNKEIKRKSSIRVQKIQKKQDLLNEFIKDINISPDQEILNYRKLLDKLDDNLKLDALKVIYEHNKKIYDKASLEYNHLIENAEIKYKHLLDSYNIKQDAYDINIILQINYEELQDSLKLLNLMDIKNSNEIIYIIENSTNKAIKDIFSYLQRTIINKKFIKSNLSILIDSSLEYTNLTTNISLLEEENINPNCFINSAKILLIDKELFKLNITTLKEYNLLSLRTTNSYNFLKNKNLSSKIDKLLQLGMEKYLEENLSLLNYENINRLYILKLLNIEITTSEELFNFLKLKNFYVEDDKIFNYIYNACSYLEIPNEEEVVDLEKYVNNRVLNINGVIFSKNKVFKSLQGTKGKLSDIKKALFKDIILQEDELNRVLQALQEAKKYLKN